MTWTVLLLIAACDSDPGDSTPPADSETDPEYQIATHCEEPAAISGPSGPTGYQRCADGSVNRAEVQPVDPNLYGTPSCEYTEYENDCREDSDCTDGENGRCVGYDNEFVAFCGCTYLCSQDSSCSEGEICLAPEAHDTRFQWPRCVRAGCTTNVDCSSGECGVVSAEYQSESAYSLACRMGEGVDVCRTHEDCQQLDYPNEGNVCWPDETGAWSCHDWYPID